MILPQGWVETQLGASCHSINYGCTSTSDAKRGDIRYIRITDIQDNDVQWDNVPYLVTPPKDIKKYELNKGDLLFARTGATVGKSYLFGDLPYRSVFASYLIRVRCNENFLCPTYAKWFFQSPRYWKQIYDGAEGTGQPNFNGTKLAHLVVPLPPLAEQRRIVAKLDSLTARIARARAELERAKRLQKQWLSKFLDSEFSCDGELLRLGELAEDVRYGTAQKCDYNPTLTPVLRIPNIASGNIDTSDLKHSTFTEKEIKKLSLCSGDLLIVRSNGSIDLVGQSAVADTQVSGFLFAGYLIRIRLKNKEVTPYFVHYWLRSPQARSAINAAAKSTSGVNNINSEQLKNLQIKIPSLSKQRIIVSRVIKAFSHADRLETEAERVLALLDRLESSLLAKAFRGELVPQDPDDEPASVLLDRIQAERAAAPKPKRGRKQSTQDTPVPRKRQTEKHG
ncbi:restriction endonuclease subunit S [Acetobacter tropicalis]|uniref:restriction endonuclease subunit S n=1 Tax=Acetobacter tropicalis TaxID=104102 RepID=UPI0039763333